MNMGFKTPYITLVLVYMIVSEVRMFLKQINETNALISVNFVLENTHKYHEKIAKLSPSSSFSYTELALFPLLYHPATQNSFKYDFKCKPKHSNKVY